MTVTNKYVLSGMDYNLNFLLLCVQVGIGQTDISAAKTYVSRSPPFALLQ